MLPETFPARLRMSGAFFYAITAEQKAFQQKQKSRQQGGRRLSDNKSSHTIRRLDPQNVPLLLVLRFLLGVGFLAFGIGLLELLEGHARCTVLCGGATQR
jgi:hypothetical protein